MIKVNLLSPEKKEVAKGFEAAPVVKEARESKVHVGAAVGAVVLILAIIGFMYFTQSHRLDSQTRYLAERRARKTELDNVLKTLEQLERAKIDLDRKVQVIGELKGRQKQTVFMMDELSRVLPDWVWLTRLNFSGGVLNISGRARTNHLIANFIDNLQSTNHFYDIRLNSSQRSRASGIDIFDFSINCRYRKSADKKAV
ncbi:MAG: PilN domain-containing protein [Candidatus Aminicenantes bacterium]|nr:PilN domain-containing protein [Candidatus Aminicenantes bacterium]